MDGSNWSCMHHMLQYFPVRVHRTQQSWDEEHIVARESDPFWLAARNEAYREELQTNEAANMATTYHAKGQFKNLTYKEIEAICLQHLKDEGYPSERQLKRYITVKNKVLYRERGY